MNWSYDIGGWLDNEVMHHTVDPVGYIFLADLTFGGTAGEGGWGVAVFCVCQGEGNSDLPGSFGISRIFHQPSLGDLYMNDLWFVCFFGGISQLQSDIMYWV